MRAPRLSPQAYSRLALVSLAALTLIVLTGAAVRLTGSGLGCPDWPKCYGKVIAPLETHAVIEYGNRVISGLVGLAAIAAFAGAWLRVPRRRDLIVIGALPPLGVLGQAVLGGFTVRHHLAPGFVMGHFGLAMVVLVAAVALAWRASREPGERPPGGDRLAVWATRALLPLAAVTIFAGTAATAAGPHAGGEGTGDEINRLELKGVDTLDWAIGQHARIALVMGLASVGAWYLLYRRGASREALRALSAVVVLLALQGLVGTVQYALELPAEIVWVHVALATLTWVSVLWAVAAAGPLAPRRPDRAGPDRDDESWRERGSVQTRQVDRSATVTSSATATDPDNHDGWARWRGRPQDRLRRDSAPT